MKPPKIPVRKAFEYSERVGHGRYVKAVAFKLKDMGFRILSVELPPDQAREVQDVSDDELRYRIAPSLGLSYGDVARHDVVAQTGSGELVVVEVQRNDQIVEARKKAKKVIIVIPGLDSGKQVEVWGEEELKEYLSR